MAEWVEVSVTVDRGRLQEAADAFLDLGCSGTEERDPAGHQRAFQQPWDTGPAPPAPPRAVVVGWWPQEEAGAVGEALEARFGTVSTQSIASEDWESSWKQGFKRLPIAPGLVVSPPWEAQEGDLIIEPGMAFGTGEHPTTRAGLAAVARLVPPARHVLDVGCGSGVLGLAAAARGAQVTGHDIDPGAIQAAQENSERNGLQAQWLVGTIDDVPVQSFDLIVANIFAEVLIPIAPEVARRSGGPVFLTGILTDRKDMVISAYGAAGLHPAHETHEGDWTHLELRP